VKLDLIDAKRVTYQCLRNSATRNNCHSMFEKQESLIVDNLLVEANGRIVLDGLSFVLPHGTLAGLIGPSGGGKSLFLKTLAGIYPLSGGNIYGYPNVGRQDGSISVSLMFQEGALFDSFSVLDNVAFPLVSGRVPIDRLAANEQDEARERSIAILARVGLDWAWAKMPGELSGGMRRRVSLARALVNHPSLLLLDDPTSGLDPVASSVIMSLIVELQKEYNSTVILVSHDLRRLLPTVGTVLALFNGRISWSGTLAEMRARGKNNSVRVSFENDSDHFKELSTFVQCRFDLLNTSEVR
jgi:phospholipid/cholesterol/gamma-HCH transport system ATP-binding protein